MTCPPGSSLDAPPDWVAPWRRRSLPLVTTPSSPPATSEGSRTSPLTTRTASSHFLSTSQTTAQVTDAVKEAEEKFGGIDVLVNNAGYGYRAAVEEGDDSDIRALFETQFFGAVAMIKAVLPGMRARRSGAIVNISTIGVQIMPAGSGYYAASKAALEAMSGALYGELQPLGISVTIVEPGAFRTDFAGRSLTQSSTVIDDYADTAGKRRKEHDTAHGTQPGDPAKAAKAIIAAVESDEPPAFLLLGNDALKTYRRLATARLDTIEAWEYLTTSTDIGA